MEEYGCTQDSLQWYWNATTGHPIVTNWFLNLITDPMGNQIQLSYTANLSSSLPRYPVDVALASVAWDSPGCLDSQHRCQGGSWQPLDQVNFLTTATTNPTPARLTNTPANCNTGATLRCDDPLDLSSTNNLPAPKLMNTFTLNDIQVQTRTCPNGNCTNWNTLRDYQLSYEQNGPTTITDPLTGSQESHAGYLDLTKITPVGDDGSTTLPSNTFGYSEHDEYYEDTNYYPTPRTNCGFPRNTGTSQTGGCVLWSMTYDGNDRYISAIYNGNNLSQTYVLSDAHNNTHELSYGLTDPLTCDGNSIAPCSVADDEAWSHIFVNYHQDNLLWSTQNGQGGTVTTSPVTSGTEYWENQYYLTYLTAQECSDCATGMYWGNQADVDYLDFYNTVFMGFSAVEVDKPDGSYDDYTFNSTEGIGVYDSTIEHNCAPNTCHQAPWWDVTNAAHGRPTAIVQYPIGGGTPLRGTSYTYSATCPPTGDPGSPTNTGYGNYHGELVGENSGQNPLASCEIHTSQQVTNFTDGGNSLNAPQLTQNYQYDGYGRTTQETDISSDGSVTSPTTIVKNIQYVWNDAVTATANSATGTYLIDFPASTEVGNSDNSIRATCSATQYDGQAYITGLSSSLTKGLATQQNGYVSCGNAGNGYVNGTALSTTMSYDQWGNPQTTTDPDANGGVSGHTGCTVNGSAASTTCTGYEGTYHDLPISSANALSQTTTAGYTSSAAGGFGFWPTSVTDANGQTTTTAYDALGRTSSVTAPGETSGLTTQSFSYTTWCAAAAAGTPCDEYDQTQRLDGTTTITQRQFYDGLGHLVETRTPAPGGQDVVQFMVYDYTERMVAKSVPYFVTAYTGSPGSAAYSVPDISQSVTSYSYDALGRVVSVIDPLSYQTTTNYQMDCGYNSDGACYNGAHVRDPNGHLTVSFTDAMGRKIYDEWFTTSGSNDTFYSHLRYTYDLAGRQTAVRLADDTHTSTATYDAAGRVTATSDPDLGSNTLTYDLNGNLLSQADARGASGTVYRCSDGLNRLMGIFTTNVCSGTTSLATYSYDSTAGGNQGIGRLTGETFTSGTTATPISGTVTHTYDTRGRDTGWSQTLTGGGTYAFSYGFNDANEQTSETYPTGDQLAYSYTQGWLAGATLTSGGTTTTLLNSVSYTGIGGASGQITSGQVGNGTYTWSQAFDGLARLTGITVQAGGTAKFSQTQAFDHAGNVTSRNTTLPTGTDNQTFCYDNLDRLIWAGSTGTPSCGSTLTTGTLSAATYTQTYGYDTLDRLTSGPAGSGYTYGDANHLDGVTSTAGGYGATYDAAGNLTCRAPSTSQTCGTTPTGQALTYDALGRQVTWQDATTNPLNTSVYGYDGNGARVEQALTNGAGTTSTVYVGSAEEISTTNGTTTTTTYFQAGPVTAVKVNGTLSYLVHDTLGSVTAALDTVGNVTASQLLTPYGSSRYNQGAMPTSYGFTGHRLDPSGLTYFNARCYDSAIGQFTSADRVRGPNRYVYVLGNPETLTDPTGYSSSTSSTSQDAPRGTDANVCIDYAVCVIFADGPDIFNPGLNHDKGGDPYAGWGDFVKEFGELYPSSVAFDFQLIPDANHGADILNTQLQELAGYAATNLFMGMVELIGHSNGAAAIFHYFALRERGTYPASYPVSRFVAIDAPIPQANFWLSLICGLCGLIQPAGEDAWSQWDAGADQADAQAYVKKQGIIGLYAYDTNDALSGSYTGPWKSYSDTKTPWWNVGNNYYEAHIRLQQSFYDGEDPAYLKALEAVI